MADLAWTQWYDDVMPQVPKAPKIAVRNAVRDSAIQLCKLGRVFVLESDAISLVQDQPEYAWTKSTFTNVDAIRAWQAFISGVKLWRASREDLDNFLQNWNTITEAPASIKYFTQLGHDNKVRLVGIPNANSASALKVWSFVAPKRSATGIHDAIGERFYQVIGAGAKWKLKAAPKDIPYSDPGGATYWEKIYKDAIASAALAADQGETGAPLDGSSAFL